MTAILHFGFKFSFRSGQKLKIDSSEAGEVNINQSNSRRFFNKFLKEGVYVNFNSKVGTTNGTPPNSLIMSTANLERSIGRVMTITLFFKVLDILFLYFH
jgi:hypothetical protein